MAQQSTRTYTLDSISKTWKEAQEVFGYTEATLLYATEDIIAWIKIGHINEKN